MKKGSVERQSRKDSSPKGAKLETKAAGVNSLSKQRVPAEKRVLAQVFDARAVSATAVWRATTKSKLRRSRPRSAQQGKSVGNQEKNEKSSGLGNAFALYGRSL